MFFHVLGVRVLGWPMVGHVVEFLLGLMWAVVGGSGFGSVIWRRVEFLVWMGFC